MTKYVIKLKMRFKKNGEEHILAAWPVNILHSPDEYDYEVEYTEEEDP